MDEHPLAILGRLQTLLLRAGCGQCAPDVQWTLEALERALGGSADPLEDARHALRRAEQHLDRQYQGRHGEALRHEIVSAAVSVGRALALRG